MTSYDCPSASRTSPTWSATSNKPLADGPAKTHVSPWLFQWLYVVAEIAIGLKASANYSFVDHTISELGSTSCRFVDGTPEQICSPWHFAMSITFIYFGSSLALGAIVLRRARPPGALATASLALWIVSGLSSIAVGLVPVNLHPGLHTAVAVWVFAAQPLALVLLGLSLRPAYRRLGGMTILVGALSAVGSIGFLLLLGSATGGGAFERLALWPGYLWVSVIAFAALRRDAPQ